MNEQLDDQEIRDGYARLGSTLAPPVDVARRVERRIVVRRRRRRAGMAGAAVLTLAVAGGSVVALAGGDDGTGRTIATDQPSGPVSTLVMTRPDGSTYAFDDVTVSCDPPDGTEGETMGGAPGRIWLTSPILIEDGDAVTDDGARPQVPFVYAEGIVDRLQAGRTFTLPVDGPGDSSTYPITFFVADTQGADRANEASSAETAATGTIRVVRASCDPVPVLQLEVDATLGSEVEQQSLAVSGSVR